MLQPRLLEKGDRIAIVAPAGKIGINSLDRSIEILKSWELEVVMGSHVFGSHGYFAGTDDERLADLNNALADPTIGAILFARGGYGTTRILDNIDIALLEIHPKWLIGFSDLTALHLKLLNADLLSIHGDVGTTLGRDEKSTAALGDLLFTGRLEIKSSEPFRAGKGRGKLIGGNLSLIIDSMGTLNEPETKGTILFIEEIEEKTYRIDRMLQQLKRAGKLADLAGLVIGQFTSISDGSTAFGSTWRECLEQIVSDYNYPVAFGWSIGHEPANYPLVHGAEYTLEVNNSAATLMTQLS